MVTLVSVWLAMLAFSLLFVSLTAALGRSMGARIRVAGLFVGPRVAGARILSVPVQVNAVPLPMGYVAFAHTGLEDQPEHTHFHDLPRLRRVVIAAGPWLSILLVCGLLLGPELAWESTARAFPQLVLGALFPNDVGRPLVAALVQLATSEPWPVLAARLWTKIAAFNLLPLPGLVGFSLPYELLRGKGPILPHRWMRIAGGVCSAALAIGWAWAVLAYALA